MRSSLLILLTTAASASASVSTTVDLVDPSDGITQPPPGIIAIDVIVDVSPQDCWTAAGMRAFVTSAGRADNVRFVYGRADDPNTPDPEQLLNPGFENRFSTFLTRPRLRDADGRYTNAGAAIAGRYYGGASATVTQHELNVAWFRSPPADANSPSVDGAIARVAIDVSWLLVAHPNAIFVAGRPSDAAGPIIVRSEVPAGEGMGTVSASFDDPNIRGLDWAVWYIPEPASIALLLIATLALRRR